MFPLSLDDEIVIRRADKFVLEVVNLQNAPASCLFRPVWQTGGDCMIDLAEVSVVELSERGGSDEEQIVEIPRTGLMVVHWIIDRPDFFTKLRDRTPMDKIRFSAHRNCIGVFGPSKARDFRLS